MNEIRSGLTAIKTLLSRDPCGHATTAIQMIDAMLAEQPAQQDIPDLIAGALGVSRGTAYDMMREALAEQPAQQAPKPIGRPHRAVMGDYGAKLVNQRIEAVVVAEAKMQAKPAETRADSSFDGGGRQPAPVQETFSEAEILAWADRHDVKGTPTDLRCMVKDAASLHLTVATQPPRAEGTLAQPLTDEQIYGMYNEPRSDAEMLEFARAIEAAHGITKGNT